MNPVHFVIISGLSGSGKSYAIKSFEDLGFFCVDNLPPQLLLKFAELCVQSQDRIRRIAVGVDIREREFLPTFFEVFEQLKEEGYRLDLLFLEARDEILVRRFSETRRPHPLAHERSVLEGIRDERAKLGELRRRADRIIDTSDVNVHALKDLIMTAYRDAGPPRRLNVFLISFGYKYGLPYDLDLLFDVRFLPNPNFVHQMKVLTGNDPEAMEYVMSSPEAKVFLDRLMDLLDLLIPLYEKEGKSYLTIGIGCTGGRHRSVAIANRLRDLLREKGHLISVRHRDVDQA